MLTGAAPEPAIEDAVLVTSELVTNAVIHAHSSPDVEVVIDDHVVSIAVNDAAHTMPLPRQATTDDLSGRGLGIVARLSEQWGYRPVHGDGKVVWACIPLHARSLTN